MFFQTLILIHMTKARRRFPVPGWVIFLFLFPVGWLVLRLGIAERLKMFQTVSIVVYIYYFDFLHEEEISCAGCYTL